MKTRRKRRANPKVRSGKYEFDGPFRETTLSLSDLDTARYRTSKSFRDNLHKRLRELVRNEDVQVRLKGGVGETLLVLNRHFIDETGRRNPSDLSVREKFDRCVSSVRSRGGVSDPEAVCASSIRRTSRKQLAKISGQGRSLAAAKHHARGLVRSRKTGRLVKRPASRIRPTAIERRGQVRNVMRQQALAKRIAARTAHRNPSSRLDFQPTGGGRYGAQHGKFLVVLTPQKIMGKDRFAAHIYYSDKPLSGTWIFGDVMAAQRNLTVADLHYLLANEKR